MPSLSLQSISDCIVHMNSSRLITYLEWLLFFDVTGADYAIGTNDVATQQIKMWKRIGLPKRKYTTRISSEIGMKTYMCGVPCANSIFKLIYHYHLKVHKNHLEIVLVFQIPKFPLELANGWFISTQFRLFSFSSLLHSDFNFNRKNRFTRFYLIHTVHLISLLERSWTVLKLLSRNHYEQIKKMKFVKNGSRHYSKLLITLV